MHCPYELSYAYENGQLHSEVRIKVLVKIRFYNSRVYLNSFLSRYTRLENSYEFT